MTDALSLLYIHCGQHTHTRNFVHLERNFNFDSHWMGQALVL